MALHLIVDGYNLLFSTGLVEGRGPLKELRGELLQTLERYQAARGHRLTVVFDGSRDEPPSSETSQARLLRVVFSESGESADEAIHRRLSDAPTETIVVTSDRDLQRSAERAGVVVVGAETFAAKVHQALAPSPEEVQEDESDEEPSLSSRKRGNPRRARRRDRRWSTWLKKL
jgi:predicted RNA-binding protein with PIN domain